MSEEDIFEKVDRVLRYVDPFLDLALKILFFMFLLMFVGIGLAILVFWW